MGYEPIDAEIEAYQDRLYVDFYDQYKNSDHYWEDKYEAVEEYLAEEILPERLEAFYLRNTDLVKASLSLLIEARELHCLKRYSASQVFAGASLEIAFKDVLLKPIVSGMIHNDTVAEMIIDIFSSHIREIDKFRGLLINVIKEISGINISEYKLDNSKQTIWEQATEVRKQRNALLHKATPATSEEAELSLSVATFVLENLFPQILKKIGLHLTEDNKIRSSYRGVIVKARPQEN
jgi:hypothetical protein